MKVALICDIHFGVRSDSEFFLNNTEKFLDGVFFPTLEREGINTVINLGDTFDRRTATNTETLNRAKTMFFDRIQDMGLRHIVILGNHDVYFKNTNRLNTLAETVAAEYKMELFDKADYVEVGGRTILLLPWMNEENAEIAMKHIRQKRADVVMGHLEIEGFQMMKNGQVSKHGLKQSLFTGYDMVLSGHYHHKSKIGNIQYLGALGEHTWADFKDPKGFHILDTETLDLEFVQNPYRMFNELTYVGEPPSYKPELLKGSYVRLRVVEKGDLLKYDQFVEELVSLGLASDVKIVEEKQNETLESLSEGVKIETTIDIINMYIDNLSDLQIDKNEMKAFFETIYTEATNKNGSI